MDNDYSTRTVTRSITVVCDGMRHYFPTGIMNELTPTDIDTLIGALRSDIVQHEAILATQNAGDREWGELYDKEGTLIKLQFIQAQQQNRL